MFATMIHTRLLFSSVQVESDKRYRGKRQRITSRSRGTNGSLSVLIFVKAHTNIATDYLRVQTPNAILSEPHHCACYGITEPRGFLSDSSIRKIDDKAF